MPDIQIDMFEVQLGAAILLQFTTSDGVVRVLADAGIKASGYQPDHVRRRLLPILDASGGRRIDLIIGTHYDEDHLNGLVPIIEDTSISIGEAWMPPVANDALEHALDAAILDSNLLAHQFYSDAGAAHLDRYLAAKRADSEVLLVLEDKETLGDRTFSTIRRESFAKSDQPASHYDYFRAQLAELTSDDDCDHGDEQELDTSPAVEAAIHDVKRTTWFANTSFAPFELRSLDRQLDILKRLGTARPKLAAAQRLSLANIRRKVANDAINAKALHEVMTALRARSIPVRAEIIDDGTPKRYTWHNDMRRFIVSNRPSSGPELVLLGPSRALVRKHWDRLPIADATWVALTFSSEIKSITPSNQLSYIARFAFANQGILITGDAGCVDFKDGRGPYYPNLLNSMLPLHVVQIAHHAGNNAHFYRVPAAAKFPEQTERSLFLLSHATDDRHRPSAEFREFLLGSLRHGDDIKLLFSSRPQRDKVEDYLSSIHPVVGSGGQVGDVRLEYQGTRWAVKAHAVSV